MEDKEIVTSGKMTQYLIGNWLLWGIFFGIIYSFIYSLITSSMESMVGRVLVAIVLQGITAILVWKCSTSSSFKKKTISHNSVSVVMKNLVIFTLLLCAIVTIYNIHNINIIVDETIESNYELKFSESMMSYLYDDDEIAKYTKQKEEAIEKVKKQYYTYLIILEIGITIVYLAILPLEKREILKYIN